MLDILFQSQRDEAAVKRLLRKLLRKQGRMPCVMVTDLVWLQPKPVSPSW